MTHHDVNPATEWTFGLFLGFDKQTEKALVNTFFYLDKQLVKYVLFSEAGCHYVALAGLALAI